MITYRNKIIGSGKWLLRLLLCAAIIHCPLSIIHCKAQPQLSLEQAIRQAQDSTIIAFQSQHEYDYYQLHYDEFTALRKPQPTLRVAPNYSRLVSDLSRDYVYLRNYDNLSAAASVKLTQKMLNWGGEAYIGTQAIWSEYFNSQATEARQFMAAPLLVGYRQTLLGYNLLENNKKWVLLCIVQNFLIFSSWVALSLLYALSMLSLCSLYACSMLALCLLYVQRIELGVVYCGYLAWKAARRSRVC